MAETSSKSRLSPWRWVVLAVFMAVNLTIQVLWISYSPIVGAASGFYGASEMSISFLSMVFMIAFVPFSIPVSWAIDRFGFRLPVTFGALLMGVSGLGRGLAGQNFTLVLISTIGMAIAQPFLLNAWTKVPAAWFPRSERASAVGLVTLASLLGTAVGQALPPMLLSSGFDIPSMQLYFGIAAMASALLFLFLAREKPQEAPEPGEDRVRVLMLDGLKHAFSVKAFLLSLAISFIGLGFFNGFNTWIEPILRPRGFTAETAGMLGALTVLSGLVGAVVMPALSDKMGSRRPFIVICLAGCLPGMLGVSFARGSALLFASGLELGFFLMGAMPLLMQYASEIACPTPEGTSNGLIQLFGQGAVVFVALMGWMRLPNGSFAPGLCLMLLLFAVSAALALRLPEPKNLSKKAAPETLPLEIQPEAEL